MGFFDKPNSKPLRSLSAASGSSSSWFWNQKGLSIIQVLVSIGLLSIVMVGTASMMSMVSNQQAQSNLTAQADLMRRSLIAALNGAGSWKSTVMDPANNRASGPMLDCIGTSAPGPAQTGYVCTTDGATDLAAGGSPITNRLIRKINDASGTAIYNTTVANSGFNLQGNACTGFVDPSAGPGNDSCPLRLQVFWSAKCTTTCLNPQIMFQIVPVFNPSSASKLVFNPANYGTPPFLQGHTPGNSCWTTVAGTLVETCNARVGIGTQNPVSPLHVKGAGGIADNTSFLSPVPIVAEVTQDGTFFGAFNKQGESAFAINIEGSSWSGQRGSVAFFDRSNGNWNRALVMKDGKVGIANNSDPQVQLDVNGAIKLGDTGVCQPGVVRFDPGAAGGLGSILFCDNTGMWRRPMTKLSSFVVHGPWVNGGSSASCPADTAMTQCHAQINSSDGQSRLFAQQIDYISNGTTLVGCSSTMSDSNDSYRLVLICTQ